MTQTELLEKILEKQTESNTLKQEGFITTTKILEKIHKEITELRTALANISEIQNTHTQQQIHQPADQWSNLPWRPYPSGTGAWIFATNRDGTPNSQAKTLIDALNKNGGKLETNTHTYKFSGQNNKFISRTPR